MIPPPNLKGNVVSVQALEYVTITYYLLVKILQIALIQTIMFPINAICEILSIIYYFELSWC